jgi:hypothetical protein
MLKNNKFKVGLLTIALSMGLTGCNIDGDNGEEGVDGEQGILKTNITIIAFR